MAGARFFEETRFILDLDDVRAVRVEDVPPAAHPSWLIEQDSAWALVPLVQPALIILREKNLQKKLEKAISNEDFETAATLRDEVKALKAQMTELSVK